MRSARHFLPSSTLPPYPLPTLQIVLSCGKWQMKRRSGLHVEHRVQAAVEVVRRRRASAAPARPMRVMMRMLSTTYDAVGQLDADLRVGEPSGPMTYGMTYIVRPFIEPSKSAPSFLYASSGAIQLLVGPASSFVGRADEGELLDARDVVRVAAMEVAAGQLLLVERREDALRDRLLGEPVLLLLGAVAPHDAVGLGEPGHLVDPIEEVLVLGQRLSGGIGRRLHRVRAPWVRARQESSVASTSIHAQVHLLPPLRIASMLPASATRGRRAAGSGAYVRHTAPASARLSRSARAAASSRSLGGLRSSPARLPASRRIAPRRAPSLAARGLVAMRSARASVTGPPDEISAVFASPHRRVAPLLALLSLAAPGALRARRRPPVRARSRAAARRRVPLRPRRTTESRPREAREGSSTPPRSSSSRRPRSTGGSTGRTACACSCRTPRPGSG